MSDESVRRKLTGISKELQTLRSELDVLEEQLIHFEDMADEARLRSLVSETPLAAEEYKDSLKAVDALNRDKEAKCKRVEKLEGKQDSLLDKLSAGLSETQ